MRLLEYQAKSLFRDYGIPVPSGVVCRSEVDVENSAGQVGEHMVLKAQVPAGKRGKGGGILFAANVPEARTRVAELLKAQVCGFPVREVLVEERLEIAREMYVAVMTDTAGGKGCPMVILSARGGMEVEEIVAGNSEVVKRLHVDPVWGLQEHQVRPLVKEAGVPGELQPAVTRVIMNLYRLYWELDGELVEINPLVVTGSGGLVAGDGKMVVDNSALYRHPGLKGTVPDSREAEAASMGLAYVQLDGNIGLISNGAGLTMATMDQLALAGGKPANFLDTGERILRDGIRDSLKLLYSNPGVRAILVNIFGGGVRCDVIAEKLIEALGIPTGQDEPGTVDNLAGNRGEMPGVAEVAVSQSSIPIVVCLRGRNEDTGRKLLQEAGLPRCEIYSSMDEAVARAARLGVEG